jgi:RNA polymerase sigma factor (sigma-70 family)
MLDDAAFAEQLLAISKRLSRYASWHRRRNREDAADLLQSTLAACWERRREFDPSRGSLITWAAWWMKDEANRQGIKLDRQHAHECELSEFVLARAESAPSQDETTLFREIAVRIDRLRPKQRAVIRLIAEGYKLREIAEAFGFSPQRAHQLISEARAAIVTETE